MTSIVDSIFGGDDQADAAVEAAQAQLQGTREAIKFQRQALAQTRGDLAPFREFGRNQLDQVSDNLGQIRNLAFSPEEQASFIQNNPFFDALAEDAERRIFNRAAASGRSGAGGTAEALQNSILLLGNDLLNQDLARKTGATQLGFGAVDTGLNAAARTGAASQVAGNAISDLTTQGANAVAAGQVGAANAIASGRQSAVDTGLGILTLGALSGGLGNIFKL